jgi:hypothetical protein
MRAQICSETADHSMMLEAVLDANFILGTRASLPLLLWSIHAQTCSETADRRRITLKSVDKNRSVIAPGRWK